MNLPSWALEALWEAWDKVSWFDGPDRMDEPHEYVPWDELESRFYFFVRKGLHSVSCAERHWPAFWMFPWWQDQGVRAFDCVCSECECLHEAFKRAVTIDGPALQAEIQRVRLREQEHAETPALPGLTDTP